MMDINSRQLAVQTFEPAAMTAAAQAADANGWVDLTNFDAALFIVNAGDWTDGTFQFVAEESDDAGVTAPTAVSAEQLDGTLPTISSDAQAAYQAGYLGDKRYIRIQTVVTDAPATGMVAGGIILAGEAEQTPVA